jgi:hypothetical protein
MREEIEMPDELKPCPFCGGSDLIAESGPSIYGGPARIICNQCEAEAHRDTWNSRAEIAIQMPEKFSPNDSGDWAYWDDQVHRSIEAAGAKWRE